MNCSIKRIKNKFFFKFFLISYIILISLSFFYNFFEYDESWIFQMIINFKKGITFTYSSAIPFGQFIYFELLSLISLSEQPSYYFSNRVMSLIANLGNVFLIYKIITKEKKYDGNQILLICLFLYSFWFCFHEGGMSSRPESLFSFLLLFLVYSFLQYEKKYYLFFISSILNIFFILYHPIGFYVLFINYCFLYYIVSKKNFLIFNFFLFFIFVLIIIIFSTSIQNFFINYNSFVLRYTGKEITEAKDIFIILFESIYRDLMFKGRARHLLGYSVYSFVYFCLLYLISIYAIFFYKRSDKNLRTFILIFISLNIFYLILPNKWRHHLGAIVPILIMIFYYMTINFTNNYFSQNKIKTYKLINIFLIIIFLIKINYHITNNYFLKNYLNNFFDTNKFFYFAKLNREQKQIYNLQEKLKNLTYTGNPVFKYVFTNSNYISNDATYDTEFFIMSKKEYCSINKMKQKINYKYFDSFTIYNHSYAICIKK